VEMRTKWYTKEKAPTYLLGLVTAILLTALGWLYTSKQEQEKAQWNSLKVVHEQVIELRIEVGVLKHLLQFGECEEKARLPDEPDIDTMFDKIEREARRRRPKNVDEFIMRQESAK